MLKRIVLSVVVLAICVPLYGVKVTFKRDGQTTREYTIIKSWTQIIQRVPYETAISRQKAYKVNDETSSLELELDPQDVVQIFTYIHEHPYMGCYTSQPVGKKFAVSENSLVLITDRGREIMAEHTAKNVNPVFVLCGDQMKYKTVLITGLLLMGMQIHAMGGDRLDGMEGGLAVRNDSSVSYIYYPAMHADIEVEGIAYDRVRNRARYLQRMINKSARDGNPFLRFAFTVKSNQVANIKQYIHEESSGTCAMRALEPLARAGVCSVPFPIRVSPLLSAAYLASGKTLGLNNVSKIEYYGNPSALKSIMKILPGVWMEFLLVSAGSYIAWVGARALLPLQEAVDESSILPE